MASSLCNCSCERCNSKGIGGLSSLPSSDAAARFVMGEEGAWKDIITSTLLRAVLIAAGMYVAGIRDRTTLTKAAIGGAVGIEMFVLAYIWRNHEKMKALPPVAERALAGAA